jgi:hypothetical protein
VNQQSAILAAVDERRSSLAVKEEMAKWALVISLKRFVPARPDLGIRGI